MRARLSSRFGRAAGSSTHRWDLVVESGPEDKTPYVRLGLVASGVLLLGCASVVPGLALGLRLVLALVALLLIGWAAKLRRRTLKPSGSSLIADAHGLVRTSPEGDKPVVHWDAPFGVTLLASYGRPQALLAFTTPTQTRYVPTRIEGRTELDDELFAGVAVLADLDLVDGITHDAALMPGDAAAILRHASAHDRAALGRVFLSDGRGAPIALDRGTLTVSTRSFDLTSHLEWRALMFHESTGQAAALYQATWIRQNASEVVLVAPMPASVVPREPNAHREARGRLGRSLTRDLRLLQSPAEPPPARDLRVPIDRPFMLAVRRALDEAPLAVRTPAPLPKPRPEERDSIV